MKFHTSFEWEKFSPDCDGFEFMFGYYDRCAWDGTGKYHLAMKIPVLPNRLPQIGEKAVVGILDKIGHFVPLAETGAWCHQQGCMELFLKHRTDCFIFNDFDEQDRKMVSRIFQLGKGIVGRYEYPVYAMSPDGKYAVSLNFGRIPRRGYSYAPALLPSDRFPADLDQEGLRLIDLESGDSKLIVSYRKMLETHPCAYTLENKYIWLNHAIFNCDSNRILWLLRSITDEIGLTKMWHTFMYTCDLSGGQVKCSLPEVYWHNGMISHQIWGAKPTEIMVDADWDGTGHHVIVYDDAETPFRARKIAESHGAMAHLVYSPDGKWILADSYPDKEKMQSLLLIDAENGKQILLGKFRQNTPQGTIGEIRCDLHPRWNPAGNIVTIDSIDSGRRAIYLLDLQEAFSELTNQKK